MSASGEGLIRLPAVTPRAPPPKSVGFQQFCDGLSTDLPVIPMVGAALIRVPGLLQGTRGPNSVLLHPWSMKLQVMLDTPTGRQSLNTYCVSVDTCWNFTRCTSWLTIVTWQSTNGKIPPCRTGLLLQDGPSRLKLIGPHKEKTELLLFPISATTGLHHVHPTWAGTFVLAAVVAVFLDSTLCCLTVIVCLSPCL